MTGDRCKHMIRRPHECRDCEAEAAAMTTPEDFAAKLPDQLANASADIMKIRALLDHSSPEGIDDFVVPGDEQFDACPTCGADAGQQCSDSAGYERGSQVHAARLTPAAPEGIEAAACPDRIWLQVESDGGALDQDSEGRTWCQDRINDTDVEYVRVDRVQP